MKIGILDVMGLPFRHLLDRFYHTVVTKQMASVTPQAISVWCRQLGHETHYATYYGHGDIQRFFPEDLDVIFISCATINSPLAYAVAKLYRKAGTLTVLGGPHARAYPVDSLRFFELVVKECDKSLIADILAGHFAPGSYISSKRPFDDLPTVEERLPEIKTSSYYFKKWKNVTNVVPTVTSLGCPYTCNFCVDWDTPYRQLPLDKLSADLAFMSKHLPGALLGFCDPNFAVKFEQVFKLLEAVPPESRVPYMMECSQSILSPSRIKRMKETKCRYFLVGIESWGDYSAKTGLGKKSSDVQKFKRTVENFQLLEENEHLMQAGFIFGLDSDAGESPVELTKEFIQQVPFAWPTVNIPAPYGGTPLFEEQRRDNRILETMPFNFYQTPYLATTIKHYDPLTYYEKLLEISIIVSANELLKQRLNQSPSWLHKFYYYLRTTGERYFTKFYRQMVDRLQTDHNFRKFHEGESPSLPPYYQQEFETQLGPYAPLLTQADRTPTLDQMAATIH